jgi:hypothetical protein
VAPVSVWANFLTWSGFPMKSSMPFVHSLIVTSQNSSGFTRLAV